MSGLLNELVVDTSALMAMLLEEPDTDRFIDLAAQAAVLHLSAASRLELGLVSEGSRHRVEDTEVEQLLLTLSVRVVPFGQHHLHWALQGWRRYGKGRHRAGLNLGDCFSYGLAMTLDLPLLFKDDDFAHTAVKPAL